MSVPRKSTAVVLVTRRSSVFAADCKWQRFPLISILFLQSLNTSHKNRKVSLTVHSKYKYFDSTVQRTENRRESFIFAVWGFP